MTPIQKPISAQPALESPASPPASSIPSSDSTASASATTTPAPAAMAKTFPPVQPGGSLILAWQIKHKKVLVVGGGEVRLNHHMPCRDSEFLVCEALVNQMLHGAINCSSFLTMFSRSPLVGSSTVSTPTPMLLSCALSPVSIPKSPFELAKVRSPTSTEYSSPKI